MTATERVMSSKNDEVLIIYSFYSPLFEPEVFHTQTYKRLYNPYIQEL